MTNTTTDSEFQVRSLTGEILWATRIPSLEDGQEAYESSAQALLTKAQELRGVPWRYLHEGWQECFSFDIPVTEETPRGDLLLQLPWGVYRLHARRPEKGQDIHVVSTSPGMIGFGGTAGENDSPPVSISGCLRPPKEGFPGWRFQPADITYENGLTSGYLGSAPLDLVEVAS